MSEKKKTASKEKEPETIRLSDEKRKALELAVLQIEKQFGRGAIMKLGETHQENVASIPTGSLSLDLATGINGVPRGRIVEIFGPESSGKRHSVSASSPRHNNGAG